jgi:hypothetical protein
VFLCIKHCPTFGESPCDFTLVSLCIFMYKTCPMFGESPCDFTLYHLFFLCIKTCPTFGESPCDFTLVSSAFCFMYKTYPWLGNHHAILPCIICIFMYKNWPNFCGIALAFFPCILFDFIKTFPCTCDFSL